MAEEIHHPHNLMVRAVLSDLAEATSFLQQHLPQAVRQVLNWSTLRLLEGSFVDEDLRASEADFLYQIEHVSGEDSVWLYVLLEHQSTPDRWMRFRLLKYCCRIWDMSFREYPDQRELRAIAPVVFYQGERSWSYSSEFADLFAESVREWPGVPHFSHGLIDQSGIAPGEVQGDLKVRLMQLLLLAAVYLHVTDNSGLGAYCTMVFFHPRGRGPHHGAEPVGVSTPAGRSRGDLLRHPCLVARRPPRYPPDASQARYASSQTLQGAHTLHRIPL